MGKVFLSFFEIILIFLFLSLFFAHQFFIENNKAFLIKIPDRVIARDFSLFFN